MAQVTKARQRRQPGVLSEARRRKILDWLQEEGSARVRDLSSAFEVSEVTIRQDLERLEGEGHVTREHGGAYLNTISTQVGSLSLQHSGEMERKRRIGARAASLVSNSETLIIDAGSTTTEVAIRLTETDTGTRIDMRSRSRLGQTDRGANARRIEAFLSDLETHIRN